MTDELPLVARLFQRWKLIALTGFLGAVIAVAYALLAPKWYEATLTVVQSQRSQESTAANLAARLPVGLDSVSTDVQRIRAVLVSNSVSDEVIDKFDLTQRYGAEHREQAREALWAHCATAVDKKSGVVSLTCEDKEPETARAIAAYFGEVGNKVFGRVSVSSAREERAFLEAQVEKARKDVDESSRKLRDFQEKNKVIDLPEQSKAVISAMASIEGDMISKQIELSYLSKFSSRTESNVVQLEQQIAIMRSKLGQLELQNDPAAARPVPAPEAGSGSGSARAAEFFPGAMTVPALRFELEQLLREEKIQETLFSLLIQRYEMAKVDEARDTSTFQILDHPTLPTFRSRPKRMNILVVGVIGGILVGCALVLLPAWLGPLLRRGDGAP